VCITLSTPNNNQTEQTKHNLRASIALGYQDESCQIHKSTKYKQQAVSAAIASQTLGQGGWRSSGSRRAPRSNQTPRNPSRTPDILCDRAPRVGPQSPPPHILAPGLHQGLPARLDEGPPARASATTSGIRRECAKCGVA
jgi:hypothetical protein